MNFRTFNSSRWRLRQANAAFAARVPPGSLVLDAGAGEAPYRDLFRHARYETADFGALEMAYAPLTYGCDLSEIPVEDGRFDFIVFNQVMEHLPDPGAVLRELHRVLKPGGKMIYSAPLFYEEHDQPYDFYRYTRFGATHLLESAGFTIEQIDWLEGYFGTVGYQLHRMGRFLPLEPRHLAPGFAGWALLPGMLVLKPLFLVLSILFHQMEKRAKFTSRGYPKNYVAIVGKPTAA